MTKAADPGAPVTALATGPTASASVLGNEPVLLARSYQIPRDDPDYSRLVNWSWTYDSAVTAVAFVALGEKDQATQILDQLAALQFNTGAIDVAFNVLSGAGAGVYRSGNVAWLGLAAATFNLRFNSNRYLGTIRRSANFLTGLQGPTGLVRGGPGISWSSTLHNLVAYSFLSRMVTADPAGATRYQAAADSIAAGIDDNLLVNDASGLHFIEGLNDTIEPLDVQALGSIYLAGRGQRSQANEVMKRIPGKFAVTAKKIKVSSDPATYNQTWSAPESFGGFKPYNSTKVPDVIWFEGTAEMRAATAATGGSPASIDAEAKKWRKVTAGDASAAPLQSNETVTSTRGDFDIEYYVWPAAAAGAWWLLASTEPGFLIP